MFASVESPSPLRVRTRIHAICNQKGGVGKTFAAMQLGAVSYHATVEPDPIMQQVAAELGDPTSPITVVSVDPQASGEWWEKQARKLRGGLPFEFIQMRDPRDLRHLRDGRRRRVIVDTPGNLENEGCVRLVLEQADDVIVPMTTEPLCYDPTARTIEKVIVPLGLPYRVFINNWEPRDGDSDLVQTREFIRRRGWRGVCNTVVRHYKIHARASAEGMVVTQYPTKTRSDLSARQDFLELGLELGLGGTPSAAVPSRAALEA